MQAICLHPPLVAFLHAARRRAAAAILVRVADIVAVAVVVRAVILAELRVEVVVPRRVLRLVLALRGVAEAERLLVILEGVARAGRLLHGVVDVLIELARVLRAEVALGLLPVVAERRLDPVPVVAEPRLAPLPGAGPVIGEPSGRVCMCPPGERRGYSRSHDRRPRRG